MAQTFATLGDKQMRLQDLITRREGLANPGAQNAARLEALRAQLARVTGRIGSEGATASVRPAYAGSAHPTGAMGAGGVVADTSALAAAMAQMGYGQPTQAGGSQTMESMRMAHPNLDAYLARLGVDPALAAQYGLTTEQQNAVMEMEAAQARAGALQGTQPTQATVDAGLGWEPTALNQASATAAQNPAWFTPEMAGQYGQIRTAENEYGFTPTSAGVAGNPLFPTHLRANLLAEAQEYARRTGDTTLLAQLRAEALTNRTERGQVLGAPAFVDPSNFMRDTTYQGTGPVTQEALNAAVPTGPMYSQFRPEITEQDIESWFAARRSRPARRVRGR